MRKRCNITWAMSAQDDLLRLYDFLCPLNRNAANKCMRKLKKSAEILKTMPNIGSKNELFPNTRELYIPFGAHNYVLRYRLQKKEVIIIRIWHSREHRT